MRFGRSFVFALVLILPNTLLGQSVIGSSGLGMKVEPLDAVQRALGGVGVPTRTSTVLPGNPVAALDILAPTVSFTIQPHWGEFQTESAQGDFFATRFPVFGFAYPLGTNGVVTLTAGSRYDQNWSVETKDSLAVGADTVGLTDNFSSEGAVTAIEAGWARRWSTKFAVGATVGVYRGGLTRKFDRTFDPHTVDSLTIDSPLDPFSTARRWSNSGLLASLSASWDPSPVLQVGATIAWPGTIKISPAERATKLTREVSAPLEFKLSTTADLSPSVSLNAGAAYSNWKDLGEESLDEAAAGKILTYGGGVQWELGNFWAGPFPLRLGVRQAEFPFRFLDEKVKESSIAAGFSVVMAQALGLPLAALDVAFEMGNRTAGSFEESFRRLTVTARVGGQ